MIALILCIECNKTYITEDSRKNYKFYEYEAINCVYNWRLNAGWLKDIPIYCLCCTKNTPSQKTIDKLKELANVEVNMKILAENAQVAGMMDIEDIADLKELRSRVAKRLDISLDELEKATKPMEAIYVIADHTRCLAFMVVFAGIGMFPLRFAVKSSCPVISPIHETIGN